MKFKGDIIITDPCYIIKDDPEKDDWDLCNYGKNMEKLGINTYLTANTEYGDWSCTTIKDDPKSEKLLNELNKMYFEFFQNYNNPSIYKTEENRKKMYDEYMAERIKKEKEGELILGNFCADAGLVSVFLLDEVLKYNPKFDYHLNRNWTTTLIKNFDGNIEITHKEGDISVVGKGNINFYTSQTGL
jgi:hypothetical protein